MNPLDQAIFDAERLLGSKVGMHDYQVIVMDAKRALILPQPTTAVFIVADGEIEAFGDLGPHRKVDVEHLLIFIIRAYRLKRGLTGEGPSA